jgi:5-methyltetrahydrofolate--homocysteine methyltransferase
MGKAMKSLREAIFDFNKDDVKEIVRERMESGGDLLALVEEAREGMDEVGRRFQTGEYFLSELIMAGVIFKEMMRQIEPRLGVGQGKKIGKIVIATVKGDVHDLGKNIVASLLQAAGVEIIDLGTDVPPETIIGRLRETGAPILGMSCLLTTSLAPMKETVERIKNSDLRDQVKVIIGGGITQGALPYVGADAQTCNASEGVSIIRSWMVPPTATGDPAHG